MRKFLYILRHAEAEPAASGQEDRKRPLSSRGIENAERMGEYLAAQGIRPELALCSTAIRCRETWVAIFPSPAGRRWREAPDEGDTTDSALSMLRRPHPNPLPEGEGTIEYVDKLYLASANEILALLKETSEDIHSLMLIGHNPGLHELCLRLAKDGPAAFPTGALAMIVFDGRWSDIGKIPARLEEFVTPGML